MTHANASFPLHPNVSLSLHLRVFLLVCIRFLVHVCFPVRVCSSATELGAQTSILRLAFFLFPVLPLVDAFFLVIGSLVVVLGPASVLGLPVFSSVPTFEMTPFRAPAFRVVAFRVIALAFHVVALAFYVVALAFYVVALAFHVVALGQQPSASASVGESPKMSQGVVMERQAQLL